MSEKTKISPHSTQKKSPNSFSTGSNRPFFQPVVQAKLTVNAPNDIYEKEADAVADKVMRMPDAAVKPVQRKCAHCEPALPAGRKEEREKLQTKPIAESTSPLLQRKAGNGAADVSQQVANSLQASKGGGKPLANETRNFMGSLFGTDFGHVNIHTGTKAVQLSRDLNAQAFAHGSDIYFNEGKFAPETANGKHLLAHELTHVVQQGATKGIQRQVDPVAAPPRQDVVYVMGTDGFHRIATHFFRARFPNATFLTANNLEAVLTHLNETFSAPLGNIFIVSHANEDGTLSFGLNSSDRDHHLTVVELRNVLHPSSGGSSTLTDVSHLIDNQTSVQIKGCDLGRNQQVVELFDETFGGAGVVTAPTHEQVYSESSSEIRAGTAEAMQTHLDEFEQTLPELPANPDPVPRGLRGEALRDARAEFSEARRVRAAAQRERRRAIVAERRRYRSEAARLGTIAGTHEALSGPMFQRPGTTLFTADELQPRVNSLYPHLNEEQRERLVERLISPDRRPRRTALSQGVYRQSGQFAYRYDAVFRFTAPQNIDEARRAFARMFRQGHFAPESVTINATQSGTTTTYQYSFAGHDSRRNRSSNAMTFNATSAPVESDDALIARVQAQVNNPDKFNWRVDENRSANGTITKEVIWERVVAYLHHGSLNASRGDYFTPPDTDRRFYAASVFENVQPKLNVGRQDDPFEKEADAVADKVMRMPDAAVKPVQRKCAHCEPALPAGRKEEQEKLQTKPVSESISPLVQRKLTAEPSYPNYLKSFLPGGNPNRDPASRLSPAQRIGHVGGLLQNLCPGFQTDSTTGTVSPINTSQTVDQVAAGNKPVGCCCQHVLIRPIANDWRVLVSDVVGPHTRESERVVVIPGPNAPIDYGNWTAGPAERRVLLTNEGILGHELCGHAALMELKAHPPNSSRLDTNVHDPTVNIQNLIATEQGQPASDLRGLAASGTQRGESFARVVISGYPANRISPFSIPDRSQQQKLSLATNLIRANDFFVDIVGHTDPSGTDAINDRVSQQRANVVKGFIAGRVPDNRHLDRQDPTTPLVNRFRSTKGVRDLQPPPLALQANPNNWRRVEIFVASFPASTENPPAVTPTTVTPVPIPAQASSLAASGDECEKELVKGAYPGISVNSGAPVISPKRQNGIQRKCAACEEAESKIQLKEIPAPVQRQEADESLSPDFTLPSPWLLQPTADPDFLSMRQPFINRGVFGLWDPDAALGVWQYNFDFFRRFGLPPDFSTTLSNLTAPRFIDAQLKLNNPTWWEITDLEMNTSTIGASIPLLEFNPDFSPVAPSWFRSIFQGGGGTVQRKPNSGDYGEVSDFRIDQSLHAQKGQGNALPDKTRDFMEQRIGADFGQVKIHNDAKAAKLSGKLNAQAFTHGNDIYFNEGKFTPETASGKHLLAHELTHVVQQGMVVQSPHIQRVNTSLNQQELALVNVLTNPRVQFMPTEITRTAYGNVGVLVGSGGSRGDGVPRLNVIIGEGTTITELASYLLPLWSLATPDVANPGILSTPPTLEELSRALLMYNYNYYGGNAMGFWQAGLRVPLPILVDSASQTAVVNTSFIQALASGFNIADAALLTTPATPSVAMPVVAGDPNIAQNAAYWEQQANAFARANTDASSRGVQLFLNIMRNARETERLYHALFRVISPDELFEMTISLLDVATNRDFQLLAFQEYGRSIIAYIELGITLYAPSTPSPEQQRKIDRGVLMMNLANSIPATVTQDMPLPETACENGIRQVMVDFVQLFDSQRSISTDLSNANRLFENCCVRFVANSVHQVDEVTSKQWIGDDLAIDDRGGTCIHPTLEERRMRSGANTEFALSAPYRAFYVKDIVRQDIVGYAFTQRCGATSFLNHLVVANDGSSTVLAHELGHLLTNRRHVHDIDNLMHKSSPGEQLTNRQCRRIFARAD